MILIEQEPHFWELYQQDQQFFLSLAVDMSSVVSCWDLVLTQAEISAYRSQHRQAIEELAKQLVQSAYRGDFSNIENRLACSEQQHLMQQCFKQWRTQT